MKPRNKCLFPQKLTETFGIRFVFIFTYSYYQLYSIVVQYPPIDLELLGSTLTL